jgi:hypothetical protein
MPIRAEIPPARSTIFGMGAPKRQHGPVCDGPHAPEIVTRSGSYQPANRCAECGRLIRNIGDVGREMWVIDAERERKARDAVGR